MLSSSDYFEAIYDNNIILLFVWRENGLMVLKIVVDKVVYIAFV